jgi:hypothetical protein
MESVAESESWRVALAWLVGCVDVVELAELRDDASTVLTRALGR